VLVTRCVPGYLVVSICLKIPKFREACADYEAILSTSSASCLPCALHWPWPWLTFGGLFTRKHLQMARSFYRPSTLFSCIFVVIYSLTYDRLVSGLPHRRWEMPAAPAVWRPQADHLTSQLLCLQTELMLTGFVTIPAVCSRQIRLELGSQSIVGQTSYYFPPGRDMVYR